MSIFLFVFSLFCSCPFLIACFRLSRTWLSIPAPWYCPRTFLSLAAVMWGWGGGGGNMCYQNGMVSFATDTVGHAVGVLGVGLLDTDWTCWAGRSWSLWLLPACESLVRSAHGAASTGPPVRSWQLPSCLPVERRPCCTWSMLLRVVSVTSLKLYIKHSPLGRRPFEQIWSWRELHLLLSCAFWYLDSWGRWVHICRILHCRVHEFVLF